MRIGCNPVPLLLRRAGGRGGVHSPDHLHPLARGRLESVGVVAHPTARIHARPDDGGADCLWGNADTVGVTGRNSGNQDALGAVPQVVVVTGARLRPSGSWRRLL